MSLKLEKGEILGVVGESGCGKSTLGRLIMRLIEPTEGQILLEGEELTGIKEQDLRKKRRDFQMIFQDPYAAFNPRMNIRQILEEPLKTYQVPKEQWNDMILKMLKLAGIPEDALGRYPHEFSGGQRQRISIARALLLNPKVIVADEPVSALDVSIQAQILNLMKDLQEDNGRELRQISVVDYKGRTAAYTGAENDPVKLHLRGDGYVIAGNILTGEDVIYEMEKAFLETKGHLSDRLMSALMAGDRVGGDKRGKQAAVLRVEKVQGFPYIDFRVDDDSEAVRKLNEIYQKNKEHIFETYDGWVENVRKGVKG